MRTTKPLYQIDGLLTTLRWLLLIGVGVVIVLQAEATGSRPSLSLLALVVLAGIGNLFIVISLAVDVSPRPVPLLALVGDTLLAVAFIVLGGGINNPLLFYAVFPILTSALRFDWRYNVITAGAIMGAYIATKVIGHSLNPADQSRALGALLLLGLVAIVSGTIGGRVKNLVLHAMRNEAEGELRQLRTRREQARAIFEMASTLSATLSYERILDAVLDVGAMGLREFGSVAQRLVSIVLLFTKDGLVVSASRRLTVRDEATRFNDVRGVIAKALKSAEPETCDDPKSDPELASFVALHRCVTAVVVPLRAGFESYGVAVFGSPEPNVFTPDHLELLTAVASQAIIALQNAQLYQRLQEEKNRIVDIEEDARKKLARDLHDGPTQSVAAIAMRLNFTRTLLKRNPSRVEDELEKLEELARKTTKEIRHMLFTLRPLVLETQGLVAALEQYVQKLHDSDDSIEVILDAIRLSDRVGKDAQGVIFYIIEEAVGNARKHAQARHIWIRLLEDSRQLTAEVRDDGVGFEVQAVQASYDKRGSLGMVNMHERAQLINGTLSVASAPGQGTRVVLSMPISMN
ncbi:MAG TPA: GAF domain-containing sensor histidine kinase [Anaerolineae bacterium]|nr:GAF domain-containing sensor histidine kinase [Anaerolineae bacterium]